MEGAAPVPGSVVGGKYRVVRLLGVGGMGAVFEAENTVTAKRVAIKWMHASLARSPGSAQRFLREAQASARVRHPNVVDVYDVVNEADGLFLVMEYLEGEPLSALMERPGMPMPYVLSCLLPAMRGVAAAHKQGVIHRDIKPDNIFLAHEADSPVPVPKVLDFGISKVMDSGLSLTSTGAAIGTPLYMSAEQLSGVKDIDARTDIYAFGVILYQIVTGEPPFNAETFPVLVVKILTEQPPDPKTLRPDVPTKLAALIKRAMARERAERTASLDELIRELEPFTNESSFRARMTLGGGELPTAATPGGRAIAAVAATPDSLDAVTRPSEGAPTLPRTGGKTPWLALAAAALVVSTLAAWLATRGGRQVAGPPPAPASSTLAKATAAPATAVVEPVPARPLDPVPAPPLEPTPTAAPEPAPAPTRPPDPAATPAPARTKPRTSKQVAASQPGGPAPLRIEKRGTPAEATARPAASQPEGTDPTFRAGKPSRGEF